MTDTERSWLESLSASYAVGGRAASLSETSGVGSDTGFAVEYAYSIVLLMLCLMSSSYIIRAVVEEADALRSPVILGALAPDLEGSRLEYWFALTRLAAEKADLLLAYEPNRLPFLACSAPPQIRLCIHKAPSLEGA